MWSVTSEVEQPAPARKRPRDRRDQILAAATRLYAAHGYHDVSMAQVAAEVGVTASALYRHFRNREDLFAETVERSCARILRQLVDAIDADASPEEVLDALVAAAVRVTIEERADAIVLLRESAYLQVQPAAGARDAKRRILELWSSWLRRMRPELRPDEIDLLVLAATGVLLGTVGHRRALARRATRPLLARMMTATLRTERPAEVSARRVPARRAAAVPAAPAARGFETSRREAVLAAAAALFRRSGYQGVGIDEIGAAAGTSGPAVYRYFRSKEELLITAYRRTGHRIAAEAAKAVEGVQTPEQALRALIASYAEVALDSEDLLVVYLREARALPPHAREEMAEIQNELISGWGRALQHEDRRLAAADARTAALATIGVLNATVPEQEAMAPQPRRAWSAAAALAAAEAA